MYKFIIFLSFVSLLSAKCSEVPVEIRKAYATDFNQAFVLQAYGKSTVAYTQFRVAYEAAKNAGESVLRLQVLEKLFEWYRMYGSSLGLFYQNPTGHDRIIGEYKKPALQYSEYKSEWGKTPDQAGTVREFMLGVAETISGVFCVTVSSGVGYGLGITLFGDGCRRMFLTLSTLYTEHQKALLSLKEWEEKSQKIVNSD